MPFEIGDRAEFLDKEPVVEEEIASVSSFADLLTLLEETTRSTPSADGPIDPARTNYQSGVGLEDRVFEPELDAADVAPDLQVMEPPVADTAAPETSLRPEARPTGLRALAEEDVNRAAQEYLGITVDGEWGRGSTRTLAGWQYQQGLPVSGEVDGATIDAMENPTTEDPRNVVARINVLNSTSTAPEISKVKDWAKTNIKDPMRAAAFVATVEAETGNRTLVENGYSLDRAVEVFVTDNKAMHVGGDLTKPLTPRGTRREAKLRALGTAASGDQIFDFIYGPDADAVGTRLGNTSPTDGSTYKGRGLVQITGKDNYKRVGDILGIDLIANPELVNDSKYAAAAAMAYLSLPGKDFFEGTLTSQKLAQAIGHTGSGTTRWARATALKTEMYP